jgi:ribonuclease HII
MKKKFPDYSLEDQAKSEGYKYIVGTDEAGRGPGAGPVVAAAVHVPNEAVYELLGKVNDSKKLTAKKREELYTIIRDTCSFGIQAISAEIIDEINILEATKLAMKSAIEQLEYYDYVLVDGTVDLNKQLYCPTRQVIKGDAKSISIAAASVLAKVFRDHIMLDLHTIFPIYGWDKNKGYLTKAHIKAIKTYGITDYHRQTFKRVGR